MPVLFFDLDVNIIGFRNASLFILCSANFEHYLSYVFIPFSILVNFEISQSFGGSCYIVGLCGMPVDLASISHSESELILLS